MLKKNQFKILGIIFWKDSVDPKCPPKGFSSVPVQLPDKQTQVESALGTFTGSALRMPAWRKAGSRTGQKEAQGHAGTAKAVADLKGPRELSHLGLGVPGLYTSASPRHPCHQK